MDGVVGLPLDTKLVTEGEAEETDEEGEQCETETNYAIGAATESNTEDCSPLPPIKTYKINSFTHWKLRDTNISLKHQVQQKHEEHCKEVGEHMKKVAGMLLACQSSAVLTSRNIRDTRNNLLKSTHKMHEICKFASEAIPRCNCAP